MSRKYYKIINYYNRTLQASGITGLSSITTGIIPTDFKETNLKKTILGLTDYQDIRDNNFKRYLYPYAKTPLKDGDNPFNLYNKEFDILNAWVEILAANAKYDNDNMRYVYICIDCHNKGNETYVW